MRELGEALTFAVVFGFIWGMFYLKYRKRREEREMVHRERMLALEKGIPLPEIPSLEENGRSMPRVPSNFLRKLMLGAGILLFCTGIGMIVAFRTLDNPADPEMHALWPIGFIPMLIGMGCLIYSAVLRRFET